MEIIQLLGSVSVHIIQQYLNSSKIQGRAIAQMVSRWLPIAAAWVQTLV
jgi:preprotein translocase subunit SecY